MGIHLCNGCTQTPKTPRFFVQTALLTFSVLGFGKVVSGQPPQVATPGSETAQTVVSTTIQAAPIEINASAPKADPDPYALPPNAPESLVKLRSEMDKITQDYQRLTGLLLKGLETKDPEKFGPPNDQGELFNGEGAESFSGVTPASTLASPRGGPALKGDPTQEELIKRLEALTQQIEMSQAEFFQEKEVFLTHGQGQPINSSVVTSVGQNMSQVQTPLEVKK